MTDPKPTPARIWVHLDAAAELLGVPKMTAYRLAHRDGWTRMKLDRAYVYDVDDVKATARRRRTA